MGAARRTPINSTATLRMAGSVSNMSPDDATFFKPWNAAYQDWAVSLGFYDKPQPYLFSLWSEPLQRFRLAAEGHGDRQPPEHLRARLKATMDPLPIWYEPFGESAGAEYPHPRADPAADGDVSQLGVAERLAETDPRDEPALPADEALAAAWVSRMATGRA